MKHLYKLIPKGIKRGLRVKPAMTVLWGYLCFALLLTSCIEKDKHFLRDETYRNQVHEQFEKRKTEAANRSKALFSVFEDDKLNTEQREALEFLYAYMPLCDLADYDSEFFLKQIDASFLARDYFSWGKNIPETIFRHFVLVYRVNNEYLDTARIAFFNELKDRVKNLSMYDAALEVNHWCHEKVTYRGTDSRTSAPLALLRTSWGRCGEESTFTATALRAVGIPARQCYTPRWVHTDDNHAWVEVWIDGEWHYLGACEPEPELDMAWFTGPAKRAMMVHTNVFGWYTGPEEKNLEMPLYAKINLLQNYAETRAVKVQVVDENNQPVEGASVQFKVYNYAELYPISVNTTGKDGITSILSGIGDLMIWAHKNDNYGYKKSEPVEAMTIVRLDRKPGAVYEESFVMNVPSEQTVKAVPADKIAANTLRLATEDSIRNAYMHTFITEEQARRLAEQNQLNPDETWKYLRLSQGNQQEISDFIIQEKKNPLLFPFLATLFAKDLRDTPAAYLSDHIQRDKTLQIKEGTPENLLVPYILSPRIEAELIQPWRQYVQQQFSEEEMAAARNGVGRIIDYIKNNIRINDDENYYNCRITPRGVSELQIADRLSRNIFFVAICRSFGIPARIEPATAKPQYFENGRWTDAGFEPEESANANLPKGRLIVQNIINNVVKPGYYSHYTLAYFKDGDFQTLDFENNPAVANFPYSLDLDEGYYRLMIGGRANDGSVSVHTQYFVLKAGKPQTIRVRLPEPEGKLFVKGIVDMNTIVELENNTKSTLKELSKGKGLTLCLLDPGKEPSKHILQDFPAVKQAFDEWGGGLLLMVPDDKINGFDASVFKGLPANAVWGIDKQRNLLQAVTGALQLTGFNDNFPLTIYLSRNGGVLFSAAGYRIGTGEEVLGVIGKEN
ncbi:MAG: transglutaminase-like domain-containing protein [Candidatus Symbiothrix sp.]|jgi:transglutaminase-like putative cysteine protease|nr:transglutaminase-like domain-containing protein [Candidatus Symbiothrix sp.]